VKKLFLLTLVCMLCGTIQVAFADRLLLVDAVKEILDTNPAALEKLKEYNASVFERNHSSAGFRPSVEISAETGYQRISNASTYFDSEDNWVTGAGITVRQRLLDGGYTKNDVKAKSALAKARLFNYCEETNKLAFTAIEAYINLLKYDWLRQLAAENIAVHQRILESVKARVQAGTGGSAALSRVQGRLAAAQSKLIGRSNDYKKALYVYHQLLGRYVDASELVLPEFNTALFPTDLQQAFKRQIDNHPSLIAADFDLKNRKMQYKRDKSSFYPHLNLELSHDWEQDYNGVEGEINDTRVMLKLDYQLYAGGAHQSLTQKNRSLIHKQQQVRNRLKRALLKDLQLTWSGYKFLDEQAATLRKSMFFTREALNSYKEEFNLGKRNLINILDAENEYQNSRAAFAASRYDQITAKYRVLFATGTLVQDLNLTSPELEELKNIKKLRPATDDTLPLNIDFDADLISNRKDLSDNNLPDTAVNLLGADREKAGRCFDSSTGTRYKEKVIKVRNVSDLENLLLPTDVTIQLEVISFKKNSVELSDASKTIMRKIIKHLKPLALDGLLQIHVTSRDSGTPAENYLLALKRGYNVMQIFAMHNMAVDRMEVFADRHEGSLKNSLRVKVVTEVQSFKGSSRIVAGTGISFPKASDKLNSSSAKALNKLADQLKSLGNPAFDIIVYSNDAGTLVANRALSQKRANALKMSLKNRGCDVNSCAAVAWGSYNQNLTLYDTDGERGTGNKVLFILRER